MFNSWNYTTDKPFNRPIFDEFIASLPESIIRAKDVIYIQEDIEHQFILPDQFDPAKLSKLSEEIMENIKSRGFGYLFLRKD